MGVPISNVTRRVVFAPSGTGPYAFTFEILAATDIEVYKGDTLLTLTTDYTVTINPNGTGSVTLVVTAGTDNITIVGARAIERTTDFVTGGDFFANTVNTEFDSLTIFAQQNSEAVTRSIQAPVTDPTTIDMTLPVKADRAGKYLSFNSSTGDPEVVNNVVDVTTVAANTANINTVAGISANVTSVAGNASNINTVAGISGNVTTVAGIAANVTTVAGISADVTTVAADGTDIGVVAGLSTEITALGPISSDITTVSGIAANVTSVAGNASNINQVAADTVAINAASTNATNAANSATAAAASAAAAAADAAAANAVSLGNEPVAPTIRPSLNLDFANVKALDPRITFTRTTTATYYDGVTTAKAEENLLIRSQDYSATWTVTNLTPVTGKTAPDGTSTATEFTAGAANAVLTQGYTAIAGSYTFSVWLRRVTGTGDIEIAADNGTWTTKVITGTWARYDVTQTVTAGSKTSGVRVVTSGDAIEVWGAQLEQRSAVTAYTPTTTQPITNYIPVLQTAAAGVARFDHNPVTGESLGLLIEEQRTNLLERSEEFENAYWSKTRSSITANTVVSPDGTVDADKLVEDTTANNTHVVQRSFTPVGNTTYTFSVYLKKAERTFALVQIGNFSQQVSANPVYVNLDTGTIVSATDLSRASITSVGNGWYRVSTTSTTIASPTLTINPIVLLSTDGTTSTYTGDGYSGIYIWGAQLESGGFSTSYIPTVASQVTCSADAASMTGTNFSSWYRADEGTFYVDVPSLPVQSGADMVLAEAFNSSASNNRRGLFVAVASGNVRWRSANAAGTITDVNRGSGATSNPVKLAAAWQDSGTFTGLSYNAEAVVSRSDAVVPLGIDSLYIGRGRNNNAYRNGYIRKLTFYPARLTDAQLQGLTT